VKGKGTFKWKATGALYDGDWKEDMRNGFGTYSIPTEDGGYTKQYSGGWKDNKKHVCIATLSVYMFIHLYCHNVSSILCLLLLGNIADMRFCLLQYRCLSVMFVHCAQMAEDIDDFFCI